MPPDPTRLQFLLGLHGVVLEYCTLGRNATNLEKRLKPRPSDFRMRCPMRVRRDGEDPTKPAGDGWVKSSLEPLTLTRCHAVAGAAYLQLITWVDSNTHTAIVCKQRNARQRMRGQPSIGECLRGYEQSAVIPMHLVHQKLQTIARGTTQNDLSYAQHSDPVREGTRSRSAKRTTANMLAVMPALLWIRCSNRPLQWREERVICTAVSHHSPGPGILHYLCG